MSAPSTAPSAACACCAADSPVPFYDYVCQACGRRIEVMHGVHATGPERCDACGGRLTRAISRPSIHFKGSGWAKMDARAQTAKADGGTSSTEGSDGEPSGTTPESAGDVTKEAPAAAETAGERSTTADAGSADGSARPAKEPAARSSRARSSARAASSKRRA